MASKRPGDAAAPGLAVALAVIFATAGFALIAGSILVVVEPTPLAGLGGGQRQDAETACFVLTLAVIVPLSVWGALRLIEAVAAGPNRKALSALVAMLGLTLGIALVSAHSWWATSGEGASAATVVAGGLWWGIAVAILARAVRGAQWSALLAAQRHASIIWLLVGGLVVVLVLCMTSLESLSLPVLAVASIAAGLSALVTSGRLRAPPRLPPRWGRVADLAVVLLVGLAAIDLVIFTPSETGVDLAGTTTLITKYHQDFILGPVNQILSGDVMLVDTASQYGVGSLLFVAGWFELAPIGYGTFGLLDGLLTAGFLAVAYAILRICRVGRLLSAGAMLLALIATVLARVYPVGTLPQEGPLRFGLPILVVLAAAAGARWQRRARPARVGMLLILAVSAVWSIEAFALTGLTFATVLAFQSAVVPRPRRLAWLARQVGLVVLTVTAAHVAFALWTLLISGQLPEWAQYLRYLRNFLGSGLGDFTYDVVPWSPGFGVAAIYLASAVALAITWRSAPTGEASAWRVTSAGLTAYGIGTFFYFVDRSSPHVLAYVSVPAILVTTLWLSRALGARSEIPRSVRSGAVVVTGLVFAVVLANAWAGLGARADHTALAHVLPGGDSPGDALERLESFPPLNSRAPRGAALLERYAPGERRSLVLVSPDLVTEVLMRAKRANRLPLAAPIGDEFAPYGRAERVRKAITALKSGDRLLTDVPGLNALARTRGSPRSTLLTRLSAGSRTSPLELVALREIDRRFELRPIHRDKLGLVVLELRARS